MLEAQHRRGKGWWKGTATLIPRGTPEFGSWAQKALRGASPREFSSPIVHNCLGGKAHAVSWREQESKSSKEPGGEIAPTNPVKRFCRIVC
jgi:hypothetical protein